LAQRDGNYDRSLPEFRSNAYQRALLDIVAGLFNTGHSFLSATAKTLLAFFEFVFRACPFAFLWWWRR
jgi:hypothetical protein